MSWNPSDPTYGSSAGGDYSINVQFDVDGIDEFPIEPAIVHDVDEEVVSITEQHTDQCGHTETDRVGDTGVDLTFNGLMTKSQHDAMKQARQENESMYVVSEPHTGTLFIDTMEFTQHSDRNEIEYKDGTETVKETVFTFNLKLTAENSDE